MFQNITPGSEGVYKVVCYKIEHLVLVPTHDKLEPPPNMKKIQNNRKKILGRSIYFSFEESGIKFHFSRFLSFFEDKNK
jgi:hypothetical protein